MHNQRTSTVKTIYISLFLCSWLACAKKESAPPTALEMRHLKMCLAEAAIAVVSAGEKATPDATLDNLGKRDEGKYLLSLDGNKTYFNPNTSVWLNYFGDNPKTKVDPETIAVFHERKFGGFLVITMSAAVYQVDTFPSFHRPMERK